MLDHTISAYTYQLWLFYLSMHIIKHQGKEGESPPGGKIASSKPGSAKSSIDSKALLLDMPKSKKKREFEESSS